MATGNPADSQFAMSDEFCALMPWRSVITALCNPSSTNYKSWGEVTSLTNKLCGLTSPCIAVLQGAYPSLKEVGDQFKLARTELSIILDLLVYMNLNSFDGMPVTITCLPSTELW